VTNCRPEYEQRTLCGALVVTLAMLLRLINCRFIIIIIIIMINVQVEPYVMTQHRPLSAAATADRNDSGLVSKSSVSGSSVKPVQHHLDRASSSFEGFIVDLMDRITNVRLTISYYR